MPYLFSFKLTHFHFIISTPNYPFIFFIFEFHIDESLFQILRLFFYFLTTILLSDCLYDFQFKYYPQLFLILNPILKNYTRKNHTM